ncbi:MAG: ATP-binding protein, partial [Chloroflexota bacterium]|nr:ATP-binding protein [Chloroflexota bacterium]
AMFSEEGRLLREMGLQLSRPAKLQQLLQSTVSGIRRLTGADYAAIATLDAQGVTQWPATEGYRTDSYKDASLNRGNSHVARAVAANGPVVLNNIASDPNFPGDFPIHKAEGGVSAVAVPMIRGGKVLGALILGNRRARQWKSDEIQIASAVANHAAMAIEQSRAATSERSQSAFLEKLVENYPGVLLVVGPPPDWRVIMANRSLNRFLPEPYRSGTPIVGLTAREFSSGDANERSIELTDALGHVYSTGESLTFNEFKSESLSMGTGYWNWTAVPVDDVGDNNERVLMFISHDITETVLARQEVEHAADAARSRADELESVVNQMADGVTIFSAEGVLKKMNPAAQRMLGVGTVPGTSPEEYTQVHLVLDLLGNPVSSEQLPLARALRGELVSGEHLTIRRTDGTDIIISISAAPLKDKKGKIEGAVSVFHDVTQEKLLDRLKDEFLSVVSHELKTPLTAIIGYSDLMLRGIHGPLSDKQVKVLNSVRANADRLLQLILDLLDVSKLESGVVHLDRRPTNVADIVLRTVAQTRILAINNGVTIKNMLARKPLLLAEADDTKLQQVVENLLSNAIKFTPEGGTITIDAHVSSMSADDPQLREAAKKQEPVPVEARSMVVSVSDTGTGLERDQLGRIWDRFYQADSSSKRRAGGTGLGLAIARSLMNLHGGQIWAESAGPDRGSTFYFSLPLVEGNVFGKEKGPRIRRGGGKPTQEDVHGTGVVLVAEDDEDQREIVCDMLEAEGYQVVVAGDGEEAVRIALEMHPKAIVLDVILPLADGWEVLQHLRADPSTHDIPVLIVSVVDQAEFGHKLGATEYLLKPLDPRNLRKAIKRLVEGSTSAERQQESTL